MVAPLAGSGPLPFDVAADVASATALPVPRAVAFRHASRELEQARAAAALHFPAWDVQALEGLPGWFKARPSVEAQPITLGQLWQRVRALDAERGVSDVDPLFLVASPAPTSEAEEAAFGLGPGDGLFGLWGTPYNDATRRAKERIEKDSDWHLEQLGVPAALERWRAKHPGRTPGAGVRIGHPDTGYTKHYELTDRFELPGRSFVLSDDGRPAPDALDDLRKGGLGILQQPGHGTATASVIVSGAGERQAPNKEVYGVAPGASVVPLRVSRSVIHLDFDILEDAILHAVQEKVDVISMSLGGPFESKSLRAAFQKARQAGVIVVSAAGNQIPTTVFPAAFPEVIGVAATHAAGEPWRYSGLGPLVDIAAPGEDVWCARAHLAGDGQPAYRTGQGTGTSFATANVAGLAALWLSYHGGRDALAAHYDDKPELVPVAFQYLLGRTANREHDFVRRGRHGAGIPDAEELLLAELPRKAELERFERVLKAQGTNLLTVVSGLFSGWLGVTEPSLAALALEATVDDEGRLLRGAVEKTDAVERARLAAEAEQQLLGEILGDQRAGLAAELVARIGADRALLAALQRWRLGASLLPLLDQLLGGAAGIAAGEQQPPTTLSAELRATLMARRVAEEQRLSRLHRGQLMSTGTAAGGPPPPALRRLRAYAFDPSLDTELETAPINQVTIPSRWEALQPGPVGEYLEVVDIDPSSSCVYAPVDLNHPHILAQDGLAPSEGDPQFHQQMVYAVAMNTIHRCELALGRPIFWAALRPWLAGRTGEQELFTPEAVRQLARADAEPGRRYREQQRDRYVQRLRIHPHALREANAYYSPGKRALLFGYFPAREEDSGKHYPGGTVFTCLSHDIIAHETTHALLDGMHPYFSEPSNEDVLAFHEAFADIMALFQKFTYPEVIRHQIANARGDLETHSLLGQLAQQFGLATTGRGALRDALGTEENGVWKRRMPDARVLSTLRMPHQRGSILVAAVFDAFIALYNDRIADLLRIATGGSGVLPAGNLHPDLVNRLADAAAQTADEVLHICIRALDYVPPVDLTFGEFLRALITADYDLTPSAGRRNRIAFIDAFRAWGIYPRDVPTLSDDSLRWRRPPPDAPIANLRHFAAFETDQRKYRSTLEALAEALEAWQPDAYQDGAARSPRGEVFYRILDAQAGMHMLLEAMQADQPERALLPGLDLRRGARFSVANLRPARRVGPLGEFLLEMIVEVVQTHQPPGDAPVSGVPFRGGATLIVDMRNWEVRYVIYKRLYEQLPERVGGPATPVDRHRRHLRFDEQRRMGTAGAAQALWQGEDAILADPLGAAYYSAEHEATRALNAIREEPFALMHRAIGQLRHEEQQP